eukprot:gene9329-9410_t
MTSGPPTASDAAPRAALLLRAARRLLRPLVWLMIRGGVTFPVLADLLRGLYVDVAWHEGQARTDSRVSVMTGIHRKEVRHLREQPALRDEVPQALSRGSLVIARWLAGADTTDESGAPRKLPRTAEPGMASFDSLVSGVTTDIRPRTLLDELLGQGMVRQDADGVISLNLQAFVPKPGDEMQMFYFGRNLADHLAAACANVAADGRAPFLDRSVHYDGLTAEQAATLESIGRERAQALLIEINRAALAMIDADKGETAAAGAATMRRVNLGVYLFAGDDLPQIRMKLAALLLPLALATSCGLPPSTGGDADVCRVGPDGGPPLLGDRGIGGTGAPPVRGLLADKGIGGTGIVGVVTGFASICLSGVEVGLPPDTSISIDGVAAAPSQLRAGQVATITSVRSDGGNLTARSVVVHHEVAGRIDAIGDGEWSVAGQRVVVSPGMWRTGETRVGMAVAVSGVRRLDGAIAATRIDPADPDRVILRNLAPRSAGGSLRSGRLAIPVDASQLGPLDIEGRVEDGRVIVDSIAPSLSLRDPGRVFGTTVSRVIAEAYVRRAGDRLELGGSASVGLAPALLTREVDRGLAIVTLELQANGTYVATDLDFRSGGPGEQRASFAPPVKGVAAAGRVRRMAEMRVAKAQAARMELARAGMARAGAAKVGAAPDIVRRDRHCVEDLDELPGDLGHFGHSVHRVQPALGGVMRQDRCGLLVVGIETRRHGFALVVRTADEFGAAAFVAHTGNRGRMEAVVIAGAAFGAAPAPACGVVMCIKANGAVRSTRTAPKVYISSGSKVALRGRGFR